MIDSAVSKWWKWTLLAESVVMNDHILWYSHLHSAFFLKPQHMYCFALPTVYKRAKDMYFLSWSVYSELYPTLTLCYHVFCFTFEIIFLDGALQSGRCSRHAWPHARSLHHALSSCSHAKQSVQMGLLHAPAYEVTHMQMERESSLLQARFCFPLVTESSSCK